MFWFLPVVKDLVWFGGGYECIEKSTDAGGRFAVAVLESDILKAIVANVYCPNDHIVVWIS